MCICANYVFLHVYKRELGVSKLSLRLGLYNSKKYFSDAASVYFGTITVCVLLIFPKRIPTNAVTGGKAILKNAEHRPTTVRWRGCFYK